MNVELLTNLFLKESKRSTNPLTVDQTSISFVFWQEISMLVNHRVTWPLLMLVYL